MRKIRRLEILVISTVIFSSLSYIFKLIIVAPIIVNLLIDWDEFSLTYMTEEDFHETNRQ